MVQGGRWLSRAALAALLVLGAGCGGDQTQQPPETSQPEQTAAQTPQQPAQQSPQTGSGGGTTPPSQPGTRAAREPETSPYGFYTIQFSSWRSQATAQAQARRLRQDGLEAYVLRSALDDGQVWYRVRAGRYPALSEAQREAQSIAGRYPGDVWVDNYTRPDQPPR